MKIRPVRITLEIVGVTDRDAWEWGDGLARALTSECAAGGEEFGPVIVECVEVDDPVRSAEAQP